MTSHNTYWLKSIRRKMAIIRELPGVKVTVEVDGQEALEYDDPDGLESDHNRKNSRWRAFKYVESKDDTFFTVKYEVDRMHYWAAPDHSLSFFVYVDGKHMDDILCEAAYFQPFRPDYAWKHTVYGARRSSSSTGMERLSKFKFSKVTTGQW